jgi:hypothetical protein
MLIPLPPRQGQIVADLVASAGGTPAGDERGP